MCKTRLKRWGFTKNNSKHRKSNYREKMKTMKSGSLMRRDAVRIVKGRAERTPVTRCDNVGPSIEDASVAGDDEMMAYDAQNHQELSDDRGFDEMEEVEDAEVGSSSTFESSSSFEPMHMLAETDVHSQGELASASDTSNTEDTSSRAEKLSASELSWEKEAFHISEPSKGASSNVR